MKTLAQLRAENNKLQAALKKKNELAKKTQEMNRLLRENKKLMMQTKYGGAISKGKKVGSVLLKTGKRLDRMATNLANI